MELARRFPQGIGVVPLYEEIRRKLEILQEHYERRSARRTNRMLNFLTFIRLLTSLALAVMGGRLVD